MAEYSGFFPSHNGDRRYFTSFFAEYFADFISNGIYVNPSTQCQVLSNNNMTVTVKPGNAYIKGYKYKNDSDKSLTIETADGVLKRIDRIVLRYTVLNREIKSYVKKGIFSDTPVAPDLQRDGDIYELGIADIYVSNGAVSISQSNITDLRLNDVYCGIVHALITQADMTTIFNQYLTWFNETKTFNTEQLAATQSEFEQEFNSWFLTIKDKLGSDPAGNLYNMIIANTNSINALDTRLTKSESKIFDDVIGTTWTNQVAPFLQIHNFASIVTGNEVIEISCASSATVDQMDAFDALRLKDGGQTAGSFTLKALGEKNAITIPIKVIVRGG